MSRIYLSGPISGYDYNERRQHFSIIKQMLEKRGHIVFNPLENGLPRDSSTHEHMRADLRALCDCDIIVMLPKWAHSAGCAREFENAVSIGCKVAFVQSLEPLVIVETYFE